MLKMNTTPLFSWLILFCRLIPAKASQQRPYPGHRAHSLDSDRPVW